MLGVTGSGRGVEGFSQLKLRTIRISLREISPSGEFTQRDVAAKLGIGVMTNYLVYERDPSVAGLPSPSPGPARLVKLAEILRVHPKDLVDVSELGPTLRQYREWVGLTQAETAVKLTANGWSINRSQYGKVESGQKQLTDKAKSKLAKVLGVSPDDITAALKI